MQVGTYPTRNFATFGPEPAIFKFDWHFTSNYTLFDTFATVLFTIFSKFFSSFPHGTIHYQLLLY
ncbi:hypothetical protein [Plasmodium yoelii yoelii]|uniref:Uncharacterized protein n=1 Tax=Plasmodium yoelii yoelii TaxID=73239 RepID=Q7RTD5_PLAYO|nr:hypothetical protein [Plasmodium yoelii yoelii]